NRWQFSWRHWIALAICRPCSRCRRYRTIRWPRARSPTPNPTRLQSCNTFGDDRVAQGTAADPQRPRSLRRLLRQDVGDRSGWRSGSFLAAALPRYGICRLLSDPAADRMPVGDDVGYRMGGPAGTPAGTVKGSRGTLCWLPNFAFDFLARNVSQKRRYDLTS